MIKITVWKQVVTYAVQNACCFAYNVLVRSVIYKGIMRHNYPMDRLTCMASQNCKARFRKRVVYLNGIPL